MNAHGTPDAQGRVWIGTAWYPAPTAVAAQSRVAAATRRAECRKAKAINPTVKLTSGAAVPGRLEPEPEAWVCVTIPVRTVNPQNGSHGHWSTASRRAKRQRETVALSLIGVDDATRTALARGCTIKLTRVSPGRLDRTNVWSALKHVADAVAAWLLGGEPGQHDDDPRLTWEEPGQLRASPGVFGVVLSIRPRANND